MEMMKERFAKLLLGGDMSGSGKGVSTALAVSNAITNLCDTLLTRYYAQNKPRKISCSLAVFCNVSQYLCIGRFSAVSFQVLGHMKTVCVLTLGWLSYFDFPVNIDPFAKAIRLLIADADFSFPYWFSMGAKYLIKRILDPNPQSTMFHFLSSKMWKREMEWLLCVGDHIVQLIMVTVELRWWQSLISI